MVRMGCWSEWDGPRSLERDILDQLELELELELKLDAFHGVRSPDRKLGIQI